MIVGLLSVWPCFAGTLSLFPSCASSPSEAIHQILIQQEKKILTFDLGLFSQDRNLFSLYVT
jgi:hypothetical protein